LKVRVFRSRPLGMEEQAAAMGDARLEQASPSKPEQPSPSPSEPSPRHDSSSSGQIAILQEKVDEGYEPTDKEIHDYAEWLGMDAEKDADLLWIAREGLKTPLPKPWQPCESASGDIFYFNPESGESKWDHPCDDELRQCYAAEKAKKANDNAGATDEAVAPKSADAARTSMHTKATLVEDLEEDSLSLEVLEEKPLQKAVKSLEKSSESEEKLEIAELEKEKSLESLSLEEKPQTLMSSNLEEKPKKTEVDKGEVEVEQIESISSFGDEETPPVAAEDLTGKALPAPPKGSEDLKECKQGESPGLALLAPLAPLGPLPPLSLPLSSLATGTLDPASAATKGKEGLEDVLGSPLDLLAGLSLGRPARSAQEEAPLKPSKDKEEHVPERPARPPPSKTRPLPPKPPSLEYTEEEAGSGAAPLESPATRPPPEEMLTPPAPATAVQSKKTEDGTDQSPAEADLDSQSPPTPQLASILAAELRPEEDGKDRLSFWSQEDCKDGGMAKASKNPPLTSPVKASVQESPGSLEISSLSAVLEQSNVCAGDAGDCSMVEELERMGEGKSDGNELSPIDIMKKACYATQQTNVAELRKLREQLENKDHESEKFGVEAKAKKDQWGSIETPQLELDGARPTASSAPLSKESQIDLKGDPLALGEDGQAEAKGSVGPEASVQAAPSLPTAAASEVQELMGTGGFRDTLKMRWDDAWLPAAKQAPLPDLGATATAASLAGVNTTMSGAAAQQRVATLEAELSALAARVKSMEADKASQQNHSSKQQSDDKLIKEDTEDKKAIPKPELNADAVEINRLRWQVRELQEESSGLARKLQDCRHEVGLEQASHSNTKAALRESQREVQQLQSQLKFRVAEVERMTHEVQRCNSELVGHAAEVQQVQSLLQARQAELSQMKTELTQAKMNLAYAHRFEPSDRHRLLRDKDNLLEAKVSQRHNLGTPSSGGSSTASIREVKYLTELSAEDPFEDQPAQGEGTPARKLSSTGGIGNLGGMQRCGSSARLCQDMSEALRARRRELRKQHVDLEEDRKKWRTEARRLKKSRSASEGPQSDSLSRSRAALDVRAASLNKAIGEYRAMQRLLTSTALKAAPAGGA